MLEPETMPRELRCQLCGNEFTCGVNAGRCWCEEVKLTVEALDQLHALFKDCVCPGCLKEFAKSN
jgi:hypothetical protein